MSPPTPRRQEHRSIRLAVIVNLPSQTPRRSSGASVDDAMRRPRPCRARRRPMKSGDNCAIRRRPTGAASNQNAKAPQSTDAITNRRRRRQSHAAHAAGGIGTTTHRSHAIITSCGAGDATRASRLSRPSIEGDRKYDSPINHRALENDIKWLKYVDMIRLAVLATAQEYNRAVVIRRWYLFQPRHASYDAGGSNLVKYAPPSATSRLQSRTTMPLSSK